MRLSHHDKQSTDIAMGVDKALERKRDDMNEDELDSIGAGDQGLQFGYASMRLRCICHMPSTWLLSLLSS